MQYRNGRRWSQSQMHNYSAIPFFRTHMSSFLMLHQCSNSRVVPPLLVNASHFTRWVLRVRGCCLQTGAETIQASAGVVRYIGLLDLAVWQHVAKVAATWFFHRLRRRRVRFVDVFGLRLERNTYWLSLHLGSTILQVCNSFLAGVPRTILDFLQRVQNAAV